MPLCRIVQFAQASRRKQSTPKQQRGQPRNGMQLAASTVPRGNNTTDQRGQKRPLECGAAGRANTSMHNALKFNLNGMPRAQPSTRINQTQSSAIGGRHQACVICGQVVHTALNSVFSESCGHLTCPACVKLAGHTLLSECLSCHDAIRRQQSGHEPHLSEGHTAVV